MKPTPYDDLLAKAGLHACYWWLESGGSVYLRRQWACIGIVQDDGQWRLQTDPPLMTRKAPNQRMGAKYMARLVAVCGEDGGRALWANRRRMMQRGTSRANAF